MVPAAPRSGVGPFEITRIAGPARELLLVMVLFATVHDINFRP